MKFWIATKPRPDLTREQFDWEWGVLHTSLVVTTRGPSSRFQRYVQHRHVDGISNDILIHPLSDHAWYSIAEHWLEDFQALGEAMGDDYQRRMGSHDFSDGSFVIELTDGEILFDQDEPFSGRGGVKLVTFVKRKEGLSQQEFARRWKEEHAPRVIQAAATENDLLRRYVQNPQMEADPAVFKGTLFEFGGIQTYAGIEEMWFDDLESLAALRTNTELYNTIVASESELVDPDGTFSMVVVERVVLDVTDGKTPPAAISVTGTIENQMATSERETSEWNIIEPVRSKVSSNQPA